MKCPCCGAQTKTYAAYKRKDGQRWRYRKCPDCAARFTTAEQRIGKVRFRLPATGLQPSPDREVLTAGW